MVAIIMYERFAGIHEFNQPAGKCRLAKLLTICIQ